MSTESDPAELSKQIEDLRRQVEQLVKRVDDLETEVRHEHEREEVLVPAEDEGEERRRDDARERLREDDVDERPQPGSAVDERRGFQIHGERLWLPE